jgi:hypothetical protein
VGWNDVSSVEHIFSVILGCVTTGMNFSGWCRFKLVRETLETCRRLLRDIRYMEQNQNSLHMFKDL